MPTKLEIADEIIKICFTCLDLSEFQHVMKSKLDIYPGDIELLWYIINKAWGEVGDDGTFELWIYTSMVLCLSVH